MKKKKQDKVEARLEALRAEYGEFNHHVVMDQTDVILIRRSVQLCDAAKALYEAQKSQAELLLNQLVAQYDNDGMTTEPTVSIGGKDDLGVIMWLPAVEKAQEEDDA